MLETTWFVLWGLLWAVYFVLDGFDFGMGTLLPFLAKNDEEKRIIYNAAGPYWDGNEVWLITAGGVTFAAFPKGLRGDVQRALRSAAHPASSPDLPRGVLRVPQQEGLPPVAQVLGRLPVPRQLPARAAARRGLRQPVHGHPDRRNGVYHGNIIKLLNPTASRAASSSC